jgi:hypothetical protein
MNDFDNVVGTTSPRWWQWPTVLSLDAPAVALVWQLTLARVARAPLAWRHVVVLTSSVWLAYVLDRWIEGWRLSPEQLRTQRHTFYQRWRWPVAVVWSVLLIGDLTIASTQLTSREWIGGLLLLAPVVLYLLSHQWIHRRHPWRVPKEVCVAALFGGGVAVFLLAPAPGLLPRLVMPLTLFTLLCFVNCTLISSWEREVDEVQGQTSLAVQYRGTGSIAIAMPWLLAAGAAALMIREPAGAARLAAACGLVSSVLLGVIDAIQGRLGWQRARVLADAALLTPLLPLATGWLR